MLSGKTSMLQALLLLLLSQQACGLLPEPRIGDESSAANTIRQDYRYSASKSKYEQKSSFNSTTAGNEEAGRPYSELNDGDDLDDEDEKIVIQEPYKSLIQHSMRFALAQSSVINYVQIDTVMDLMNDTGYILSSPQMLKKALRMATIVGASFMALMLFVPKVYWRHLTSGWAQSRGRLLEIERFLPNGLNEMGIITLLEQKTEELLARLELNNNACRQQSICQLGELLRCAFPKGSKSVVSFISENFSRPRYRDNAHIGSFLKGFIDLNCAANTEMDQSKSCLSSYIKSLSACAPPVQRPEPARESYPPRFQFLQTLQANRA